MSTTSKRGSGAGIGVSAAWLNAAAMLFALGMGMWMLVERGQMPWPPSRLLVAVYTVSGCLGLVGPIVLFRREGSDSGVGDWMWLTGGVLMWLYNVTALVRGQVDLARWVTPLTYPTLGLVSLAVLIAGWRLGGGGRVWTWTNVLGWLLGTFWIVMGLWTLAPGAGGVWGRSN